MHAPVAQGIEQRTSNPLVAGSNPARRTSKTRVPGSLEIPGTLFCVLELPFTLDL